MGNSASKTGGIISLIVGVLLLLFAFIWYYEQNNNNTTTTNTIPTYIWVLGGLGVLLIIIGIILLLWDSFSTPSPSQNIRYQQCPPIQQGMPPPIQQGASLPPGSQMSSNVTYYPTVQGT